jgi:3-hydroxybutyryl-CoA dehydrogenase
LKDNKGVSQMSFQKIGVLGAGQMGAGIAQVAAQVGYQVFLADADLSRAEKGKDGIAQRLSKDLAKGKITDIQMQETLGNLHPVADLQGLKDCDIVIEAVSENETLKLSLFKQLDEICQPSAILASNTSSIPITRIAASTKRPEKVIGMHFMNPVPVMKLVEIINGLATSDESYQATKAMAEKMGKVTVLSRDVSGFIVNRILMPMINEAVFALYEGIGTKEDIDQGMKLGTNQPMGPLTLADFIGLDTCLAIMEVLHKGLGDSKYRPCPLLRQYVEAGWLGKKSGRGFYQY